MIERSVPQRRVQLILFAIVAVSVLAQITGFTRFEDLRYFQKYWQLAADLTAGELNPERLNDVSPLYLWFVTMVRAFEVSPNALRMTQIAMSGLTSLLAALVALRVGGAVAAISTALFLVLNRALLVNATELEPETIIVLLNTAALYLLFGTSRKATRPLAAGLLFGLSAAARLVVVPAALVTGLVALWRGGAPDDRRETLRNAAWFGAGLGAPLIGTILITFALTGTPSIMNPGTVFYEGWNPDTAGYALTEPLIVTDVTNELDAPDALHLAYRLIASRLTGEPATPELANRFWTGQAFDYIRCFPGRAVRLAAAKFFFSFHSYDAWDLAMMVTRYRQAEAWFWIPFGLLASLAAISLIDRAREPTVLALWLYSLCYLSLFVAFYVTSRQRNALLPAMAILAGLSLSALASRARRDRRGALLRLLLVGCLAVLLTRTYRWQAENSYKWTASFNSEAVVASMHEAERDGREDEAMRLRAIDRTWLLGDDPHIPSAPRQLVGAIAKGELSQADSPQRLFDLAVALQYARDWPTSDEILAWLEENDYHPIRQTKAVDSVAYYRALAALHTGQMEAAERFLDRASSEDPADPHVLALRTVLLADERSKEMLALLHDRFTAEMAMARAHYETGNIQTALEVISGVTRVIPEWSRARLFEAYLTDVIEGSASTPTGAAVDGQAPLSDDG